MLKKYFFIVFVPLLVAGQALAQQASYVTNSTVTMETDGTNPAGSVNLQTNNAGRINFLTNRTNRGYIDGTTGAFTGFSLANPTISGNLTFTSATAKIIPGATSLTFRNNADSADNLGITDAGIVTFRNQVTSIISSANNKIEVGANSIRTAIGALAAGPGYVGTTSNHDLQILTNNASRWIVSTAGALTQDATNGGNISISKSGTGIIFGAATIETGQQIHLYTGASGAIKPNNTPLEIEIAANGGANISNASANISGYYFSNPTSSYDGGIEYGNTSRALTLRAGGAVRFTVSNTGTFIGTGTSDIGWTIQSAANQACNTTCVTPCVFGQETTSKAILSCSDATADSCLCAGAS